MLLKNINIFILLVIAASCSTPKEQDHTSLQKNGNVKEENMMEGKIISKTFVNKGGKEISTIQDLYFDTGAETYFIKFMDSNITYEEAKKLLDQPIQITGEIKEGLWDVPDDNPQYAQSRTGFYLVIHNVIN